MTLNSRLLDANRARLVFASMSNPTFGSLGFSPALMIDPMGNSTPPFGLGVPFGPPCVDSALLLVLSTTNRVVSMPPPPLTVLVYG